MLASLLTALMIQTAASSLALPLHRVDEQSWFHVPGVDDFRLQKIMRTGNEQDWPFTIDDGYLLCAFVLGQRVAYFSPIPREGEKATTPVMVSSNPFDLAFGNMPGRQLVRSDLSLEKLIVLMAPLEVTGKRLCDQPPGSHIGPGEL